MFLGKLVFSMKLIKSVVSLRYDSCICVIDGVRRSTNNESRPVGPSHPILGSLRSYDGNCKENVSLKLNFALS